MSDLTSPGSRFRNEMLCGFMALYNYQGPLAPGLNFVKNSLTHFYSLFISSSALHLASKANALNH